MDFTHTRFGKCTIADINQGQLEQFSETMAGAGDMPMTIWRGKAVRAAISAGILIAPVFTDEQVAKEKPGLIRWISDCIAEVIAEASRIDPLS